MKLKELRDMSPDELVRKSGELRHEIMNLRVQQASGQLENPARIRLVRRDIARIQTLLGERLRTPVSAR
jgi:large subunit ribosomal protein L29